MFKYDNENQELGMLNPLFSEWRINLKPTCVQWIIAGFSIAIIVIVLGGAVYIWGASTLVDVAQNNWPFCVGILVVGGAGFLIFLLRAMIDNQPKA